MKYEAVSKKGLALGPHYPLPVGRMSARVTASTPLGVILENDHCTDARRQRLTLFRLLGFSADCRFQQTVQYVEKEASEVRTGAAETSEPSKKKEIYEERRIISERVQEAGMRAREG
jgi:hypothetical protein